MVKLGDGIESIKNIFNDVEEGLIKLDIESEGREYTPHITLGRIKESQPLLEKDIVPMEEKRFILDRVVCFRAHLQKRGLRIPLNGT